MSKDSAKKYRFKTAYDSPLVKRIPLFAIRVRLLTENDRRFHGTHERWLCNWGTGIVHGPQSEAFLFCGKADVPKVMAFLEWLQRDYEPANKPYAFELMEVDVQTFSDMAKRSETSTSQVS